jgi:hypothetical protein
MQVTQPHRPAAQAHPPRQHSAGRAAAGGPLNLQPAAAQEAAAAAAGAGAGGPLKLQRSGQRQQRQRRQSRGVLTCSAVRWPEVPSPRPRPTPEPTHKPSETALPPASPGRSTLLCVDASAWPGNSGGSGHRVVGWRMDEQQRQQFEAIARRMLDLRLGCILHACSCPCRVIVRNLYVGDGVPPSSNLARIMMMLHLLQPPPAVDDEDVLTLFGP